MYTLKILDSPLGAPPTYPDHAFGLNYNGNVAGFSYVASGRAILWKPEPVILPPVDSGHPQRSTMAIGINDSDDVVGVFESELVFPGQAFLCREGVMADLSSLFNAEQSMARAINNSGLILATAGEISPGPPQEHFLYNSKTGGAPISLGSGFSAANAINNKGQLVGVVRGKAETRGIFVDGSERMDLGPGASPEDLNDVGQVVGSRLAEGASLPTAFLCGTSNGTPQFEDLGTLPLPGPTRSVASGINNTGDVVGACSTELPGGVRISRSFVRLAGGVMQDLNALIPAGSGVLLGDSPKINDKGQIAGNCFFNGAQRVYLLSPQVGGRPSDAYTAGVHILIGLIGGERELTYIPRGLPVRPDPIVQWALLSPEKRDILAGIALSELASLAHDVRSRQELERGALNMIRRALDQLANTDESRA